MSHFRRLTISAAILIGCLQLMQPAIASKAEDERMMRDARIDERTHLEQLNDFIGHSKVVGKPVKKTIRVVHGQINAKLLTPLNSSFNKNGDDVRAVVTDSMSDSGRPWLEPGTIIEGTVESAHSATYGQTDGTITIRFYKATHGDDSIELFAESDTDDGRLAPGRAKPLSKKQKIRGILMTVTKIAVPAAIGTGGMSLAITTGAGAAIGLAFSDKGHRIAGTVRGAWEGSGLNFLDPLVQKGRTVVIPADTPIQLQLSEAVVAPEIKITAKQSNEFRTEEDVSANSLTSMQTHAQILTPATIAENQAKSAAALERVNKKIAQNDLASALVELQTAENDLPNDANLQDKHSELLNLISGQTKSN